MWPYWISVMIIIRNIRIEESCIFLIFGKVLSSNKNLFCNTNLSNHDPLYLYYLISTLFLFLCQYFRFLFKLRHHRYNIPVAIFTNIITGVFLKSIDIYFKIWAVSIFILIYRHLFYKQTCIYFINLGTSTSYDIFFFN